MFRSCGGGIKTYEKVFYRKFRKKGNHKGDYYGFAGKTYNWCNGELKIQALTNIRKAILSRSYGTKSKQTGKYILEYSPQITEEQILRFSDGKRGVVQQQVENVGNKFFKSPIHKGGYKIVEYIGIASDEIERIERHKIKPNIIMPLVDIGWQESDCRKWCEENNLLSPVYTDGTRDGCWFCHNQGIGQLRRLRKNYPQLWNILMQWDNDSPVSFKPAGHTVHDFDKRFELEDKGLIDKDDTFRWEFLTKPPDKQLNFLGDLKW